MGVGRVSCEQWFTLGHGAEEEWRFKIQQWVVGFVSGANIYTKNDILQGTCLKPGPGPRADACSEKIANYDAVISWMDNYCKAHPLDTIADAAGELVRALEEKAAKRSE